MTDKHQSKADQVSSLRIDRATTREKAKSSDGCVVASTLDMDENGARKSNLIGFNSQTEPSNDKAGSAGVAPGPSEAKRGRPRIGEVRTKPWLECDPPMSKSTYYRRKREALQQLMEAK
jgi:hypothetical protein